MQDVYHNASYLLDTAVFNGSSSNNGALGREVTALQRICQHTLEHMLYCSFHAMLAQLCPSASCAVAAGDASQSDRHRRQRMQFAMLHVLPLHIHPLMSLRTTAQNSGDVDIGRGTYLDSATSETNSTAAENFPAEPVAGRHVVTLKIGAPLCSDTPGNVSSATARQPL